MGRNSDGSGRTMTDGELRALNENSEPLANIKDREAYKEVFRGISRFEATLGIRDRKVRLADLSGYGVAGMAVHQKRTGKPLGIFLDKNTFDRKADDIRGYVKKQYESGFWAKTKAPIQHTVTHELAHATLNRSMRTANALAAKRELKKVYNDWKRDTDAQHRWGKYAKKQWGTYARIGGPYEFWSEGITKGVHGGSDSYTKRLIKIAKKYNL